MGKVEAFLERQDKILSHDRDRILIALGLTEKEYSPNGKKNMLYTQCEYMNGEKRYYRDVAMEITDEQWNQILEKVNQISVSKDIKLQSGAERERENRPSFRGIWMPVFKKETYTYGRENEEEEDKQSGSSMPSVLRISAVIVIIMGIILSANNLWISEMLLFFYVGGAVIIALVMFGVASVLDYLAELTAIARNGYKYKE